MAGRGTVGVALMGMGGPEGLEAVQPFLESLFSDPAILPVPSFVRPRLARFIAGRRAPASRERYRLMGGASPIHGYTQAQVEALSRHLGAGFEVRHVFRYTEPRASTVMEDLAARGVERVVAVASYPQRSFTTSDSSLADLEAASRARGIHVAAVPSYPDDAGFIRALSDATSEVLHQARGDAHVVMVAHAVPRRSVRRGDPYVSEVHRTARALARSLPRRVRWDVAFQSRVGPVGWVGPSLEETLGRLGAAGVTSVVIVPVSFTSEHLETLVELDLEARETAAIAGIGDFHRVPAPGMHGAFIEMLARLVRRQVDRG